MTMAAGLACMKQMTPDAFHHLARLGDKMRDGLRSILNDADVPGQVTGQGSLVGLYFVDKPFATYRDLPTDNRARKMFGALHRHLLNRGVYSTSYGLFVLSTAMADADIDKVLSEVKAGLPAARMAVA
jgi:glutamate-1-semialdehyde 2,1-aminomutase